MPKTLEDKLLNHYITSRNSDVYCPFKVSDNKTKSVYQFFNPKNGDATVKGKNNKVGNYHPVAPCFKKTNLTECYTIDGEFKYSVFYDPINKTYKVEKVERSHKKKKKMFKREKLSGASHAKSTEKSLQNEATINSLTRLGANTYVTYASKPHPLQQLTYPFLSLFMPLPLPPPQKQRYGITQQEYYNAKNLREFINESDKTLSMLQKLNILLRIAEQLSKDYHHRAGEKILHRDLKLENILVYEENNEFRVKIIDNGLAVISKKEENLFYVGENCAGTLGYIALEHLNKNAVRIFSEKSEIYALGMTFLLFLVSKAREKLSQLYNSSSNASLLFFHDKVKDLIKSDDINEIIHEQLQTLLSSMIEINIQNRPSLQRVIDILTNLAKNQPSPYYNKDNEDKEDKHAEKQTDLYFEEILKLIPQKTQQYNLRM